MQQSKVAKPWIRKKILINYFSALLLIGQAWLIAHIIDEALIQHVDLKSLIIPLILLTLVMILRAGISWKQEIVGFEASAIVRTQVRRLFLKEIKTKGPIKINQEKAGEINSLFIEHIESLHGFYADYLPQMQLSIMVPLTIFVFVFSMDWIAALILLITAPLIPLFMALIGMGVESANQKHFKSLAKLSADFFDKLKGITTLKLFNQSKQQTENIAASAEEYRQRTMAVLRVAFLSSGALELFSSVAIAIVAVILGLTLLNKIGIGYFDNLTLAKALFILLLAPEYFLPLRQLGVHYHARAEAIAAATELSSFIQSRPLHSEKQFDLLVNENYLLEIKNLSFFYKEGENIFNEFNLTIKPQEKIAIVGPSGVGKSTLIYLIMGLLQPKLGEIFVNQQNLNDIKIEQWQQEIAYFGQMPQLLPASIKDNIKFANEKATENEIIQAAEKAGVMEFIADFPEGLNTLIGEQNLGISGGQAQRIALARIFLANRPILILDEPTASLDEAMELKIIKSITEHCQNKTIIIVSHRLQTVKFADKVISLK